MPKKQTRWMKYKKKRIGTITAEERAIGIAEKQPLWMRQAKRDAIKAVQKRALQLEGLNRGKLEELGIDSQVWAGRWTTIGRINKDIIKLDDALLRESRGRTITSSEATEEARQVKGERQKKHKVFTYLDTTSKKQREKLLKSGKAKKPTRQALQDIQQRYTQYVDNILKSKENQAVFAKSDGQKLEYELNELKLGLSHGPTLTIKAAKSALQQFRELNAELVSQRKNLRAKPIDEYLKLFRQSTDKVWVGTPQTKRFRNQMELYPKLGEEARRLYLKLEMSFPESTLQKTTTRGGFNTQKEASLAVKNFMKKLEGGKPVKLKKKS